MKILLATVLIIVGGFMSYVAIGGFLEKQSKEQKTQTIIDNSPSNSNTSSSSTPAANTNKTFTTDEVPQHSKASDCWLIIDGKVYEVTKYIQDHPGGASAIIDYCGQEATQAFATQGGGGSHSNQARSILGDYEIGLLKK